MRLSALVASAVLIVVATNAGDVDNEHLKCLVCRATMKEVKKELAKVDPKRNIDVGNYRLDAKGNEIKKTVPMARSAVHISDVLDDVCDKLSDYVRATDKESGKLMILNLMSPSGSMNPAISKVDIVQDGDLNKSLEHLCKDIISEDEDDVIKFFQNEKNHDTNVICEHVCDETMAVEEVVDEGENEVEGKDKIVKKNEL